MSHDSRVLLRLASARGRSSTNSSQLTVVAKFKAKSGLETAFYQELLHLIAPTLAEAGCLNYDLHRSIEDDTVFLFYENWSSKSVWEQHMESEHIKTFQRNTKGMIDNSELLLMKPELRF